MRKKSINYTYTKEMWDLGEMNIDSVFSFKVAIEILNDFQHKIVYKCTQRHN